jgi:hypothetical protein
MVAQFERIESLAEKIVERLSAIESDVAVIKSNYATKADIAKAKNAIVMWVVSALLLAQVLPTLLTVFGM